MNMGARSKPEAQSPSGMHTATLTVALAASSHSSCASILGQLEPVLSAGRSCVCLHSGQGLRNLALSFLLRMCSSLDLCSLITKMIA